MGNCVVAPFLFANSSPKIIINKANIPVRLLERMILVFQIVDGKEFLNPRSMHQWPQFVERLPSLPEGSLFPSLRSQHRLPFFCKSTTANAG
jgi:hypothetical protein